MTKKELIVNGIMENATISNGETLVASYTNFVVMQGFDFGGKIKYDFFSYNTLVASLVLFDSEADRWILRIKKNIRWSNTTKKDVNVAIGAILEKFGCPAKVIIYTKKGKVGALCDMHHIKIEVE